MKYKVLMTLMGLDIGGAETHVVELSKELKNRAMTSSLHPTAVCMNRNWRKRGSVTTKCP